MRINHDVLGSKDPLVTKEGLASVDLATMPIERINSILEEDYSIGGGSNTAPFKAFEAEGPLIDAINNCPFIEIIGMVDENGNKIDFTPKGEIKHIYHYKDTHIAILDTGKPCVLFEGAWKPMYLVEEPQFKEKSCLDHYFQQKQD
jgi:hypothetical protein